MNWASHEALFIYFESSCFREEFLIGAMEVCDLVAIKVPDPGGNFVDEVLIVGHQ